MRARKLFAAMSVASTLTVLAPILAATPAAANGGACPAAPSAFKPWDTSTEPYQADNAADFNGDGRVCARPTKYTFVEDGQTFPVYLFIDNNVRS